VHSWWNLQPLMCHQGERALPTRCNYTNTIRARSSALSPLHCAYNSAAPSRNWALSRPASAFCASCFLAIPRALFYFCVCSLSQGRQIIKSYLSPCCWREHGFYNPSVYFISCASYNKYLHHYAECSDTQFIYA
jgi:hypothetical protein